MSSNTNPPPSNDKHSLDGNGNDFAIDESVFAFTPRRLRVVCVGAGFSGLIMAYKLKHERPLSFVDFTIYEKNPEVGGTWYENVYPGVGCDIPIHSYIFYFNPNPHWSQCYAKGPEIQQYILGTAERYGLRERIQFKTKVISSIWNEEEGKWDLRLQRGKEVFEDKADVLINGSGVLNKWTFPDIEGIDTFQGKLVHTAKWDPSYDWTDKRIAVIGNGSSGLQVVPALQPKASKIVNYIRHPTWISVNIAGDITKDHRGTNFAYTEEEKKLYRENPEAFLEYRKYVERSVNSVFKIMLSGSEENKFLFNHVSQVMRERLSKSPHLIEKLIPDYEIGCRRLSPGDGYLEAMQADNARFCFNSIVCITPQGIRTVSETGTESDEEFDLIVCATGFNTSFIPAWTLIGRDGRRLDHEWKDIPTAYFSLCAGGMPNYFVFGGPNAPIGHGSNPLIMAWNADYMLDWIEKIAMEDIKSVAVKDSIVHAFNRYAAENLKRCVWSKGCTAWYNKQNGSGEGNTVTALYPGSALHYKEYIKTIRGEHFDIRYNTSNPFRFLGNGELEMERNGGDTAYYLQ
ncbi:flavin-containing monooxygenase [Aspergillus foveolatus]|uniref:flavin-containing monooxygenase n=1 Tax=Aspergillus foveolatus TaxID=210207 RepID=UPI003CCCFAEA